MACANCSIPEGENSGACGRRRGKPSVSGADGLTMCEAAGAPALAGWLPVGVWVHLDDVLLAGAWSGLSPLFVERASFQPGKGWKLEAENQQGLDDLLGVLQG